MPQSIIQVNAFTNRPFSGNPAAVCILPAPGEEEWMRQVAAEMNLPETAFLHETGAGYRLRWFTPTEEEDLCGHATLAAAHVLWTEEGADPALPLHFDTRSGRLTARRKGDWIALDFPAEPIQLATGIDPVLQEHYGELLRAQGANRLDHFLELASEEDVLTFRPEAALEHLSGRRGLIVSSRAESGGYDIVSRFFAPARGIPEDPVTGSAHCALGPYWAERLGKADLNARQASERGGSLRVRPWGDRVHLFGQAVTVWRGELVE